MSKQGGYFSILDVRARSVATSGVDRVFVRRGGALTPTTTVAAVATISIYKHYWCCIGTYSTRRKGGGGGVVRDRQKDREGGYPATAISASYEIDLLLPVSPPPLPPPPSPINVHPPTSLPRAPVGIVQIIKKRVAKVFDFIMTMLCPIFLMNNDQPLPVCVCACLLARSLSFKCACARLLACVCVSECVCVRACVCTQIMSVCLSTCACMSAGMTEYVCACVRVQITTLQSVVEHITKREKGRRRYKKKKPEQNIPVPGRTGL